MAEVCLICGLVGFISTMITFALGFRIISKYPKYKDKNFLYVGLSFILMWSAWWGSSISFITYLINGEGLPFIAYIFLGNFFVPFTLLTWLISMFSLFNVKGTQKIIGILLCLIYILILEIAVIYYIFNPDELGYLRNPLVPIYNLSFYLLLIPIIATIIVTGLIFSFRSLKATKPNIRLKGKFLTTAFLLMAIGVLSEIFLSGDFYLLISRFVIVIGLISLYIGFTLPNKIKNLLIKSE